MVNIVSLSLLLSIFLSFWSQQVTSFHPVREFFVKPPRINQQDDTSSRITTTSRRSLDSSSSSSIDNDKPYFLRKALMADLSQAAKVLVDGFYQENSAVSKWWEKLQTQMSLESNFPNPIRMTTNPQHEMWVACHNTDGQVLAFCEVDNRPPRPRQQQQSTKSNDTRIIVRPYMCNLAVHSEWRKLGLAQELIRQCESSVELWKSYSISPNTESCVLYLKVKEHNFPAVQLYQKMGYEVMATECDEKTEDVLLVMKREWKVTSACVVDQKEDVSSSHPSNSFEI